MAKTIRTNKDYPKGYISGFHLCRRVKGECKPCPGGVRGVIVRVTDKGACLKFVRGFSHR